MLFRADPRLAHDLGPFGNLFADHCANSAGVLATISNPTFAMRSFDSGSFMMRMTSPLSLSTMGRGVPRS